MPAQEVRAKAHLGDSLVRGKVDQLGKVTVLRKGLVKEVAPLARAAAVARAAEVTKEVAAQGLDDQEEGAVEATLAVGDRYILVEHLTSMVFPDEEKIHVAGRDMYLSVYCALVYVSR